MKRPASFLTLLMIIFLAFGSTVVSSQSPELVLGPEQLIWEAEKDENGRSGIDRIAAALNPETGETLIAHEDIVSLAELGYGDEYEYWGTTLIRLTLLDASGQVQKSDALLSQHLKGITTYPSTHSVEVIWNQEVRKFILAYARTLINLKTGEVSPSQVFLILVSPDGRLGEPFQVPDDASESLQYHPSLAVDEASGRVLAVWIKIYQEVKKEFRFEVFAQLYQPTLDGVLIPVGHVQRVFGERNYIQAPLAFWVRGKPFVLATYPYFDGKDAASDIYLKNLETGQELKVNNRDTGEQYDVEVGSVVETPDGQIALVYARREGRVLTLPNEIVFQTVDANLSEAKISEPRVLVYQWGVFAPRLLSFGDNFLVAFLELRPWEYCPVLWCGLQQVGRIGLFNPDAAVLPETLPLSEKEVSQSPARLISYNKGGGRVFWVYYGYGIGARYLSLNF